METSSKLPTYLKLSQIVLGLTAFFYILFIGQDIIVPLIYAMLIAILLNPFVNLLCRWRFPRVIAILVAILTAFILITAIIYFLSAQTVKFSSEFPQIKEKFNLMFKDLIDWTSQTFNLSIKKINTSINNMKVEGMKNGGVVIGQTLSTVSGLLIMIFLLPVYVFMILFYKSLFVQFIGQLFPKSQHETVGEVLIETKALVQNYLLGLMIELLIVAALNATVLLVLGIEYAILLGLIGAILNLIPYIGGVVAIALPMLIAIATKEPMYAIYVFIGYIIVQFIDNNFLVPKIVASKVKINALVSIIVVLIGGALWGVAGMFLSIPLTAILKVMFDRIEPLKPWGFLLGDTIPAIVSFKIKIPKKKVIQK